MRKKLFLASGAALFFMAGVISAWLGQMPWVKGSLPGAYEGMIIACAIIAAVGIAATGFFILRLSREKDAVRAITDSIERFRRGEARVGLKRSGPGELGELEDALSRLFAMLHEDRSAQKQYMSIIGWESAEKERERERLKTSEERFKGLVESSRDWVWEANAEGVYTYSSQGVERMLGYTPEEVLGKTLFELMLPAKAGATGFRNIAAAKEPFTNIEKMNLSKDGRVVVLETSGTPFFAPNGAFLGYRGMDRDITQRKAAERSEKTAAMEMFANRTAQRINDPAKATAGSLNTLSGYLDSFGRLIVLYEEHAIAMGRVDFEEAARLRDEIETLRKEIDMGRAVKEIERFVLESKENISRISTIAKCLKDLPPENAGEATPCDPPKLKDKVSGG